MKADKSFSLWTLRHRYRRCLFLHSVVLWFIYFSIDSNYFISPPLPTVSFSLMLYFLLLHTSPHLFSPLPNGSIFLFSLFYLPPSCFLLLSFLTSTSLLSDVQRLDFSGIEPDVKPFEERFGRRIVVSCHDLTFSLQGCISEKGDSVLTNVCHYLTSTTHSASTALLFI